MSNRIYLGDPISHLELMGGLFGLSGAIGSETHLRIFGAMKKVSGEDDLVPIYIDQDLFDKADELLREALKG